MIEIKSIFSFVPKNFISKEKLKKKLGKNNFRKIHNYTGFKKLHVLKKKQEPAEFFFQSIDKFFKVTKINKNKIDAIIFSSHTRGQEMPIFSAKIQSKFQLRNDIICYDLPGSCSGFTNGLIHSSAFLNSKIADTVLLICADAHSKNLDKNLIPLIGDGLSCMIIKRKKNITKIDYGVDGSNNEILTIESTTKKLKMDGIEVFKFAVKRVPETYSNILKKIKCKIDFYCFHQPNKNIHDHLIRKLNIDFNKVISTFDFGNTSAASIPIAISKNFSNRNIVNKNFLFCGFGAGLTWSTIVTRLHKTYVSKVYFI